MTRRAVALRRYRAEDNQALSDIWLRASARAHSFFTREQLAEQQKRVSEVYLPNAETWIACEGAGLLGLIGLINEFIGGLFVDPQYQGSGVGRTLVNHAMKLGDSPILAVCARNSRGPDLLRTVGYSGG